MKTYFNLSNKEKTKIVSKAVSSSKKQIDEVVKKADSRNFTITEPMKKHYVIEIDGKKWTISNFQKEVFLGYLKWMKSHTPTFETVNLIGNMLGWPEWYLLKTKGESSQT